MKKANWYGKPYYSLDAYCKNTYGEKLYKIAINAGLTCPNRDGTLGNNGCIFCSAGGSGDFAVDRLSYPSIGAQLAAGRALFRCKQAACRYIAYFQAYTNTYGPLPYLHTIYEEALSESCVAGISIATRPDCLADNVLTLLVNLKQKFPDKFVWIELGLQTIHEETARFIRRGYPLEVYDNCVKRLQKAGIPVITHVILGLPGEIPQQALQTIGHLNAIGTWGIKLQLLHILKGTDLASLYEEGKYHPLSKESYLALLIRCLEHLSPNIVVHRLTGDGPGDLLLAPVWSRNKRDVLNTLHHTMKLQDARQGSHYDERLTL